MRIFHGRCRTGAGWWLGSRVRRRIGNVFASGLTFAALPLIFRNAHLGTPEQDRVAAGVCAFLVFLWLAKGNRSRYVPRAVRRTVIARDLKGEKFDPHRHHIDHVWPFSKGGSNTVDNLRVIEKRRNLCKSARRPHIWEMW